MMKLLIFTPISLDAKSNYSQFVAKFNEFQAHLASIGATDNVVKLGDVMNKGLDTELANHMGYLCSLYTMKPMTYAHAVVSNYRVDCPQSFGALVHYVSEHYKCKEMTFDNVDSSVEYFATPEGQSIEGDVGDIVIILDGTPSEGMNFSVHITMPNSKIWELGDYAFIVANGAAELLPVFAEHFKEVYDKGCIAIREVTE